MGKLRAYTDLEELLYKEASEKESEEKSKQLIEFMADFSPDYKYLVVFIEPDDPQDFSAALEHGRILVLDEVVAKLVGI